MQHTHTHIHGDDDGRIKNTNIHMHEEDSDRQSISLCVFFFLIKTVETRKKKRCLNCVKSFGANFAWFSFGFDQFQMFI